jgi:hypothetical protein
VSARVWTLLLIAALAAPGPARAQQVPAPAEEEEEEAVLLPPDEELAPDDLLFDDDPGGGSEAPGEGEVGAGPSASEGDASADPDALEAEALEAEALGLEEAPAEAPAAVPDPTVAPEVAPPAQRTTSEISTALTIGLVGCGALAAVGALLGVIAHPVVASVMVFNVFAPAIALPLCGGTLVINQTLAAASVWAMCVAAPAPSVVAAGAGVAGAAGQAAVTEPWVPLGAAALAAVPGVLVGVLAGGVVLGGVAYGLSLEHLSLERLQRGDVEAVYLTLPRAITGAVVALVGAILGVVAAPLAGGGAVGIGYAVAGMEAVDEEAAAVVAERPVPPADGSSLVEVSW